MMGASLRLLRARGAPGDAHGCGGKDRRRARHPRGLLPPYTQAAPQCPGTPSPALLGAPSAARLELPPPLAWHRQTASPRLLA